MLEFCILKFYILQVSINVICLSLNYHRAGRFKSGSQNIISTSIQQKQFEHNDFHVFKIIFFQYQFQSYFLRKFLSEQPSFRINNKYNFLSIEIFAIFNEHHLQNL